MPRPGCLSTSCPTLSTSQPLASVRRSRPRRVGFAHDQITFEFTENERMVDVPRVQRIITEYRKQGFLTALDDFGAGHAGLNLLANFQPDLIKLDMELIRGISTSPTRQTIIACVTTMARELGITVLAEGVESEAELTALRAAGIRLFQGYYLAKPALAMLPNVQLAVAA